jgi:hypothetical protein
MLASYKRSDYWCPPCLQGGALSVRNMPRQDALCAPRQGRELRQHASLSACVLCVVAWLQYKAKPLHES